MSQADRRSLRFMPIIAAAPLLFDHAANALEDRPEGISESSAQGCVRELSLGAQSGTLIGSLDQYRVFDGTSCMAAPYRGPDAKPGDLIVFIGTLILLHGKPQIHQNVVMNTPIVFITGTTADSGVTLSWGKASKHFEIREHYPLAPAHVGVSVLQSPSKHLDTSGRAGLSRLRHIAVAVQPIIKDIRFASSWIRY